MPVFFAPPKPQVKPVIVALPACARCGGAHQAVEFKALTKPMATPSGDTLTHWALCPTTGEPVLLRIDGPKETSSNG